MATKSQLTQNVAMQEGRTPRPKRKKVRRDRPVDTAKPGVSATDRKAGKGHTALRNVSKKGTRKGVAELEDSTTERPTRKSTRRSSSHTKAATPLQNRQVNRVRSPKASAARAAARAR